MIECYIEGSGVVWTHLHPNFFMQNILTTLGLPNGQLRWPMGHKRVGWIAAEDLADISATVLAGGPAMHGGQNYFLSTDVLNGQEAAAILSEILGRASGSRVIERNCWRRLAVDYPNPRCSRVPW